METVGERIRAAREHRKLTQEQLAAKVGVTRVAVSEWERNLTTPRVAKARLLARILGLPEIDLTPLEGLSRPASMPASPPLKWEDVPSMLRDLERVAVGERYQLSVDDDSMEPDYRRGDAIEIDTTIAPWDGCQVVAAVEASATRGVLRNYRQRPKGYDLWPSNPDYQTHTLTADESAHVLGVVVFHGRRIEPPR